MRRPHLRTLLALAVALLSGSALAQQGSPRIGYVYPAGGQRGSTFQITLGGQFLAGASEVVVSGEGIRGHVLEHSRPLTNREASLLKDQLTELQARRLAALAKPATSATRPSTRPTWSSEDQKQLEAIREKLAKLAPRPQGNQALLETVRVEMTLAAGADTGPYSLRLKTAQGLTNPLAFHVGQLREFTPPPAEPLRDTRVAPATQNAVVEPPLPLPLVINGQIMPGEIDRYRFKARKGQRLVAVVQARALIPYIADAVPGWFQATLTLHDSKGREVAYDDDFRFSPDPVLSCAIPADDEYVLEIRDAIYRGREDFVYRLAVGELPFVTSVSPLGAPAGPNASIEVAGWNLLQPRITRLAAKPAVRTLWVNGKEAESNRFLFQVDTLPEVGEAEANDSRERARLLTLPSIVNGRIDKAGDTDVFRFEGRRGQQAVLEVTARRLGSPLDSLLVLSDAKGQEIARNDDWTDKGEGLATHHADSYLSVTLPADGVYYVHLSDTQRNGGSEYAYRLRVSEPRPDFELRVTPSTLNLRPGQSGKLTAHVMRRDGFSGEIVLALKNPPRGLTLAGGKIPAGKDKAEMTLSVAAAASRDAMELIVEGGAQIGNEWRSREAVPADDMMQAFAYRHLVPADNLMLAINARPQPPRAASPATRPAAPKTN